MQSMRTVEKEMYQPPCNAMLLTKSGTKESDDLLLHL
jgi:hypothetical protein